MLMRYLLECHCSACDIDDSCLLHRAILILQTLNLVFDCAKKIRIQPFTKYQNYNRIDWQKQIKKCIKTEKQMFAVSVHANANIR